MLLIRAAIRDETSSVGNNLGSDFCRILRLKELFVIYTLPYGKQEVALTLPAAARADMICHMPADSASANPNTLFQRALAQPIGSPSLRELARGRSRAVVLISDKSRLSPSWLFLPLLLDQLNAGGIEDSNITAIVALGTHRQHTEAELRQLAGEEAYRRIRVLNHSALEEDCVEVGTTRQGTPVRINRQVVTADLRIATGNIEPHRLAGMSGGCKALFPGVASGRSIEANHSLSQTYKVAPGEPDNPIRRDLEEAHLLVPIHFLFNVIVGPGRVPLAAVAGDAIEAHRAGAEIARRQFIINAKNDYDVVIASAGGYPKDLQLYQAVKTLQNAAGLVRRGGAILLLAECSEHYGNGVLQQWLETIGDRAEMVSRIRQRFTLGAHKIEHIDKVLQKHPVWFYSSMPDPLVELVGFKPVHLLQETVNTLVRPDDQVAIMPYGALTFPQTTPNERKIENELEPVVP